MNQPDLGLKITELRQQKGLTQEKLAEYCDVSARTIQRIENGEVEPRPFTRNSLSNILEFDLGKENTDHETVLLTLLHFSSIVCFIPLSLVVWSSRKSESYKVDQQGRAVLNFQITMILILFSLVLLMIIVPSFLMMLRLPQDASGTLFGISPVLILLISFFTTYQGSMNLYRALTGKPIHYPLSIPFVK
jgi:uncharacterized Tic20 family protein/DNA-binding Xre family transcriptional regulator